jgi:hypothetical protein
MTNDNCKVVDKSPNTRSQNSAYVLYKMLRKSGIKDIVDNAYLSKQTENLSNITQTLKNRRKLNIRNLEVKNNLSACKSKSTAFVQRESIGGSEGNGGIFLTNFNKKSLTTKRTTIGNSSVILHPNVRLSDAFNLVDKKKGVQLANQLTIKNNNNIKVYCFKPTTRFSFKSFSDDVYKDAHKNSNYNSMFSRIIVDNDYKRVQNLESKVSKCIIKSPHVRDNVLLPKIK